MRPLEALQARGRARLKQLGLPAAADFACALGYSDFLYRLLHRLAPDAAEALLDEARRPLTRARLRRLVARGDSLEDGVERGLALIALRETTGLMSTRAALLAASALAGAAVTRALAGEPDLPSGFVVFALGKLGGRELNFYSDLDLVYAAPPVRREREELARLQAVRRITARLERCWQVDLRLRPFGRAGALVMSFPAMEAYFHNHGREWERYAWIKARALAGDRARANALLSSLHPFVYRRYLDYHVVEALREMKRQVLEAGGERTGDIKHGAGGIREIEFIVQAFQLIRGGRESALATPRLRSALVAAGRSGVLGAAETRKLLAAYECLRRVENRLQIEQRVPEHRLPASEPRRSRLAASLGFGDWSELARELTRQRRAVRRIFDAIFALPAPPAHRSPAARLWRAESAPQQAQALARSLGFRRPRAAVEALTRFKASRSVRLMSARARVALDRVAPDLIADAAAGGEPDAAVARLLGLLVALTRRSAYLALLVERPPARARLADLVGKSAWIAKRLAANPVALDELLDPRVAAPAGRLQLVREFGKVAALAREPERASRRFREINAVQRLKVAALFAGGGLSARAAERNLSLVAEGAVRAALALARASMQRRHGQLECELLAVAYGKLGGRELGFGSDLDLVFVYDTRAERSGEGLASEVYVARVAQRTISLLSQPTQLGALYEVDTRLRPEGTAGLLISRFDAWRRYQREKAWLWERQALLRARPVAGSARLARRFHAERAALLARPVEPEVLRGALVAMRSRAAGAGGARPGRAPILLEGEFLAAWWLLAALADCPRIVSRRGFEAQLAALADCGTRHPARELGEALGVLRRQGHCAVLGIAGDSLAFARARAWVQDHWARATQP